MAISQAITQCTEEENVQPNHHGQFLLLGFSDVRVLQILHFVVFLVIYLAALLGNLLIITAIALDHRLHIPMYFFLINLSILDLGSISVLMAYNQFITICQTLHYETVMNRRVCVQMAASAWISGIFYSALHTRNTFAISFCGGNVIDQFFCEIPQLLKLTCSDLYLSEVGALIFGVSAVSCCFVFIIVTYVQIFTTVLRIPSEQGQHKAFSTCLLTLL
ncbi:olfactory receptor 14A16-like [Emys orbicularis]|uniref:olfactory receptor 14A16-like n=1 Tax=Emys orbicularis TaxID=82168 RepID=UPI0031FD1153